MHAGTGVGSGPSAQSCPPYPTVETEKVTPIIRHKGTLEETANIEY
jgi:hypothetical protein